MKMQSESGIVGDVKEQVELAQEEYFQDNSKSRLFKKNQKFDCAESVVDSVSLEKLLGATIFRIGSRIIVDYTLLKTFAYPKLYNSIAQYGLTMVQQAIIEYGTYEVHLNLKSFSISAVERYKPLVESFFQEMPPEDTQYYTNLKNVFIYHPPSFFSTLHNIVKRFVTSDPESVIIRLINKDVSDVEYQNLTMMMN